MFASFYPRLASLRKIGLTVTLYLIGSGISRSTLKQVGLRPLPQGRISQEVRAATRRHKADGVAATRLRLGIAQMRFVRGDIELVLRNHVAM